MRRVAPAVSGAVTAVLALVLLAGCSAKSAPTNPAPAHTTTSAPTPAATPSRTATPAPQFIHGGSAKANKPYFDSVNTTLLERDPSAGGKDVINALVAAGFDKANMQVTPDTTTIGRKVDSVLFSVRIDTECLLGQLSGSQYTSSVQAALADGTCLVGKTRPIDW